MSHSCCLLLVPEDAEAGQEMTIGGVVRHRRKTGLQLTRTPLIRKAVRSLRPDRFSFPSTLNTPEMLRATHAVHKLAGV